MTGRCPMACSRASRSASSPTDISRAGRLRACGPQLPETFHMLPNWVSCCEVDGQVVFLDILANRYSRLGKTLGDALIRGELNDRSEEHTSELQSLMRNSYAGFRLKKKNNNKQ